MVGELVTVDQNARTFAIKTAAEGEVKFSYSETTEIVGVEKGASGLAAKSGNRSDGALRLAWHRQSCDAGRGAAEEVIIGAEGSDYAAGS